jgi:hypothetical protein
LVGCSWWESDVLHVPPTPEFTFADGVDRINLVANPAGDKFEYSWTSTGPVTIKQDEENKLQAYFKIPPGTTGEDTDITLEVRHKKRSKTSTQTVTIPPYSYVRAYGLGKSAVVEKNNGVDYEWYVDQGTSTYPMVDCGPSTVTMAIKWFNRDFPGSPATARSIYRPGGGWWYTSDILSYLVNNNTLNYVVPLSSPNDLKREIDKGNILILCLDMYYVSDETKKEYHINKFYKTGAPEWGHFVLVKGYKEVETDGSRRMYMEVYDAYSLGNTYDGTALKGKDRYYSASDLITASDKWWRYAIVVTRSNNIARMGVNVENVPDQKGR